LKNDASNPSSAALRVSDCIATDNGNHEVFNGSAAMNTYQSTQYGCDKLLEMFVTKFQFIRFQLQVTVMPSGVSTICIHER
jgi:hypothetical protein